MLALAFTMETHKSCGPNLDQTYQRRMAMPLVSS